MDFVARIRFRLLPQRVSQRLQAFFGHIENEITLRAAVFAEALEVVLDAGDGIGEGIQALPVRNRLLSKQLFLNIAVAGVQQCGGTCQRNHGQPTARLGQKLGYARQVLMVPLGGDEFDDRVLGLLQASSRLANHQAMNLRHVGGGQMALFAPLIRCTAHHAGQRRLDIQQCTCDIHQRRVVRLPLPLSQGFDHADLIEHDPPGLTETQHGERIGDLLERRLQRAKLGQPKAITAHEQVQAVLDSNQLLAQSGHDRAHRSSVRTRQLGALLIDQGTVRQRIIQAVFGFQRLDAWGLGRCLGYVEEQVLDQLVRCRLVDPVGALGNEALELLVDLTQQVPNRGAVGDCTAGEPLDHARCDLPQRAQRRFLAEHFQTREDPRHVAQIGRQVLIAYDANQCDLQHLSQFAKQARKFFGLSLSQKLMGKRWRAGRHVG